MRINKELLVYVTPSVTGPRDIQYHTDSIAAVCATLGVGMVRQEDLSALGPRPAIGLEAQGTQQQLDQLVKRLIEKNYVIEDGGRQVHALDEEGGAQ